MAHGGAFRSDGWSLASMALLFAALGLCSVACNDDSDGGGGAGGGAAGGGTAGSGAVSAAAPVGASDFGQRFADVFCASIGPCCARAGHAFTESTCNASLKALIDGAVAANSAPGVQFDATAAGDCVEAYRAVAATCTTRQDVADEACAHVWVGTVPEGGDCTIDAECADIASAEYVLCNAGVCTAGPPSLGSAVHGAQGDACSASCSADDFSTSCVGTTSASGQAPVVPTSCWADDGLYCDEGRTCSPLPNVGDRCPEAICAPDAYCDFPGSTCMASTATGPCTSSDECLHTSYCDVNAGQCTPVKANGQACNDDLECQSANCDGGVCREWSVATAATCAGVLTD